MKYRLIAVGCMTIVLGLAGCSVLSEALNPAPTPIPPGDSGAIPQSEATVESADPAAAPDLPAGEGSIQCVAENGEAVYINQEQGYCLAYPADFTINEQETGATVIFGTVYGPDTSGFVHISSQPVVGQTAPQISDEMVADFLGTEILPERTDNLLGGEPAVDIIGMPGQDLTWDVVAVHNDTAYTLVFSPLGEENGDPFKDMQTLYEVIMRSFQFTQ